MKKEVDSWQANQTYDLIPIAEKKAGASIVPLGELYTRKRDQSYKFRQYLMGNLLKSGKDFHDTFSATVTWDGIRWCCSLACACGKQVYGWDAVTGYLQAPEQKDVYAYLPSHQMYSELSYEKIAEFRTTLLKLVQKEGEAGLKKFAARHKRESRSNPTHCLRLNKCVYGNPSAGHEFEMLIRSAHLKGAGMTQTQVEPSIYLKILVDDEDVVQEYVIAYVYVDDCRYFGTDLAVKRYEEQIKKSLKVTFTGPSADFVGVKCKQDLKLGLFELTIPEYWLKAVNSFKQFFPSGCKYRAVPISVADDKVMTEAVTDEEFAEAKNLPYRQLCGVVSYPAASVKIEMRYVVSVCGRYRAKWGLKQWAVLKKAFEYGYATRHVGILYSRDLDPHGRNVLYGFADSSHSVPRSQGCEVVMMNGGALSCDSKKHTVTGTSTCHDELISFTKCGNKTMGFRNLMKEAGMCAQKPSVVAQDNEAAIQILMNRGSLSSRTKHIDLNVLSSRNKIEDQEIVPEYVETSLMRADFGTKALGADLFCKHRDAVNGYGLVKRHLPSFPLPEMIVDPWECSPAD